MYKPWRAVVAFLVALVVCDTMTPKLQSWLSSPDIRALRFLEMWLGSQAGPELLEIVVLGTVFALGGAALAAAVPRPFGKAGPALALGSAYSLVLWLFFPWLPGIRGSVEPPWLPALASAPYYVPALASACGAAVFGWIKRR